MSEPFLFVLAVLATWRASALLVREDGPVDVVARLRRLVTRRAGWRVFECFYCTSLWVAAPVALWLVGATREWPLIWFAISGGAGLLERATAKAAAEQPMELDQAAEFINQARR